MKRAIWFISCLVILGWGSGAFAQDEKKPEKKWTEEAELSYVDTGGNTNVKTLSANNLLKYTFTNQLVGAWKVGALYAEDSGNTTAERYFTNLRLDYLFTERLYSFALGDWLRDDYAGLHNRYYGGLGVGYKILTGPRNSLLAELGPNYVQEEYTDHTKRDFLGGRAFGQYVLAITEKNRFTQTLEFLYDFDDSENYNLNSETAIISALNSYLSLKASYVIRYDHKPVPSDLRKTDTILLVALLVTL